MESLFFSVAQLVILLLPHLSFPDPNNRISAVKNCSYGNRQDLGASLYVCVCVCVCVCVLFVETTCCVLRLRGRSLLRRRLGIVRRWPECGLGLCTPHKKRQYKEP